VLETKVQEAARIGVKKAKALIALCEESGDIQSTPRQAKRGGEIRRGTPEQVAEYLTPRLAVKVSP
jgi:hypothetical protein